MKKLDTRICQKETRNVSLQKLESKKENQNENQKLEAEQKLETKV